MCGRAASARGAGALSAVSGARRFLAASSYRPSHNIGPLSRLPVLRLVHENEAKEIEDAEHDDDGSDSGGGLKGGSKTPGEVGDNDSCREKKDDDDDNDDDGSDGAAGAIASSSSSSPSTTTEESSTAEEPTDMDAATEGEMGTEKAKSKKQLVLQPMRWGLVPCFSKEDQTSRFASQMINARSEGVRSSPIFRRLLAKNRCVVVADGFFEWQKFEKNGQTKKQPYYVFPSPSHQPSPIVLDHYSTETTKDDTHSTTTATDSDSDLTSKTSTLDSDNNATTNDSNTPLSLSEADKRPLLLLAGLFDRWTDPKTGKVLYTFTVLTTEPTQNLGWLHDRMPVVLTEERAKKWLDVYHTPFEECVSFLSPYKHNLEWYAVPDTVNSIRNKSPECTEKLEDVMARRKANGIGRFFASTSKPQATKGKVPDFNKPNEERLSNSKAAPDLPTPTDVGNKLAPPMPSPAISSPTKPKTASTIETKEAPTKASKTTDEATTRGSKRKAEPKASPKKATTSTKKPKVKASPKKLKAEPDSKQRTLASFFGK